MIRSHRSYLAAAALALGLGGSAGGLLVARLREDAPEPLIAGPRDAFGRPKYGTPWCPKKCRQGPGQDRKEKRYVRKGLRP